MVVRLSSARSIALAAALTAASGVMAQQTETWSPQWRPAGSPPRAAATSSEWATAFDKAPTTVSLPSPERSSSAALTTSSQQSPAISTERSQTIEIARPPALGVPRLQTPRLLAQTGQMSSKPPEFTIPPTTTAAPGAAATQSTAVDATKPADAGSDKAANEEKQSFQGHAPVQDAFDRLATGTFKNTKYKWYGFVRMDGIYDVKPIKTTDMFVTSSIPIPQGEGQNMVLTPRYTRLGFDTETKMDCPDWTIKTRIEMDFFNGNTSGLFGSFPLRLRFAWIEFDHIRAGQDASLFMDYDVFPNVLDYEGPPGMVLMRQPVFSLRFKPDDHWKVAVGVEQPYSDIEWFDGAGWVVNPGTGIITDPTVPKNVQDLVDFTGHIRYEHDYGHTQVAGIMRKLSYQPVGANNLDEFGYGVNVTGTFHPWAFASGCPKNTESCDVSLKSRFLGQYAAGKGINRYIQDVNGLGLDATFDPINGFQPIPCQGWFISYEHWFSKKWIGVLTGGATESNLTNTLPGDTYKKAEYVAATLIWLPVERMGVGWEVLYGSRENKDGARGEAYRLQTGIQYRF